MAHAHSAIQCGDGVSAAQLRLYQPSERHMPTTTEEVLKISYTHWGKYNEIMLLRKGKQWYYPIISLRKQKPIRRRHISDKTHTTL